MFKFAVVVLISYNWFVMESVDASAIGTSLTREALPVEPRVVVTLIKEGTAPAPATEKL